MSETDFSKQPVETQTKGLGTLKAGALTGDIRAQGWNILREDVSLPVAVLLEERIEHNLSWMREFIQRYRLKLAPHGKTTMSPELYQLQTQYGAWGITLATAPQVNVAFQHGVRKVIMANQLVGKGNMAMIAGLLREDPDFDFTCIVDSAENVNALGHYFAGQQLRLRIMFEYGIVGGRTGIRTDQQEADVLAAVKRWPQSLALVGVELYEGVSNDEAVIRTFLRHVLARTEVLAQAGEFAEPTVILTGAGSAWFDVVAEELTREDPHLDAQKRYTLDIILRSGCYVTHDVGAYQAALERMQTSNPVAREMNSSLQPALQVWAAVQSLPEPGRAIIALGKRDAGYDAGYPKAAGHFRPRSATQAGYTTVVPAPENWKVYAMMDQHAFMSIPENADLKVGDMLVFDICHPCLTFDKWRQLLLVNEQWDVTGAVKTWF
ncbi:D-serine dehydratase [Rahnella sp. BIGb0603]|jgi:D-serine dehydratase|uniref:amino acid deaminase n=1 Tax=Rahnella sp. BIGb0603 TaxID=2940612 RepID=UPI002167E78B|nr:amino acid deaminase [Rahnella sp. BIGb0603]MCS3425979.1 D-serine dehydratase [Rahnella sp. BIGb0603]